MLIDSGLLIELYGIEIGLTAKALLATLLLIELYGIEIAIKEFNGDFEGLLIELYGIEITDSYLFRALQDTFNRTIWN